MNALKLRRGAKTDFAGRTEEQLRRRLAAIHALKREVRREHAGRFRDEALADVDQLQIEARAASAEAMTRLALTGNPRPLGSGAGPAIADDVLEAHAKYRLANDDGYFDDLREEINGATEGFSDVTRTELDALLEPLELEARAITAELGRRHDERRELRDRLRALEAPEA